MSSRVIKPVSTRTIKNQKESINKIATMVDLLNLNGIMIKHRSQEIYLNKNSQNDKSNNSYLLTENNKQTSQQEFSQKNQKNKNALSPRFMSPYNQKAKIISKEKKKIIHNKKASLEIPFLIPSSEFILSDIIKSFPTTFLIFSIISITILALFSSLPPYSSVLLLKIGLKKSLTR